MSSTLDSLDRKTWTYRPDPNGPIRQVTFLARALIQTTKPPFSEPTLVNNSSKVSVPQENTAMAAFDTFSVRLKAQLEAANLVNRAWSEGELVLHLQQYKRRKERTIRCTMNQLAFMARHPVFPVQLHRDALSLVTSFWHYTQHREHQEGTKAGALRNDHKAVRALGDFLRIPENVWPTAPAEVKHDDRFIPSPEQVHALLHANYTPCPKTTYENHLVKGLLVFDILIGPRFPSEAHAFRLRDFDPKRHVCTITEPKKSGRRRNLLIEPRWLCCSPRHPSLANYLVWRRKVDPDGKQEAFFLQPDGTPFASKDALRNYLRKMVKPRFPWFYPYLGRHWSATARLIDWDFDYPRVADWLGHNGINTLRAEYDHNSKILKSEHGGGWLARAGRLTDRKPKNGVSVNATGEK